MSPLIFPISIGAPPKAPTATVESSTAVELLLVAKHRAILVQSVDLLIRNLGSWPRCAQNKFCHSRQKKENWNEEAYRFTGRGAGCHNHYRLRGRFSPCSPTSPAAAIATIRLTCLRCTEPKEPGGGRDYHSARRQFRFR